MSVQTVEEATKEPEPIPAALQPFVGETGQEEGEEEPNEYDM